MSRIGLIGDNIDQTDIQALIQWLSSDPIPRLTQGPLTAELESKWAKKIGSRYSVFVNSGSSAILLLLASLKETGRLRNNRIVVPAVSWATDVSVPMLLGMDPLLCDCNLQDLSCDLNQLEKLFQTHQPAAFLLVSPLGLVPDMQRIIDLCQQHNVLLLEDVCESMGSRYQNRCLGTFGLASVFSTYFGHHISTIEGGFVNTDDEDLYHSLLLMRSHGWARDLPHESRRKLQEINHVDDFQALYTFYLPGMNLRSTDLQAFIGLRSIEKLDSIVNQRWENFQHYQSRVKSEWLDLKVRPGDIVSSFAYPMMSSNREDTIQKLVDNNIEVRPLIAGNIANQPFVQRRWIGTNKLYNANLVDKCGFYVPNHQHLSKADIDLICDTIS